MMQIFRLRTIRSQLIAWNALTLTLLLGALGMLAHYIADSYSIASIDRLLQDRAKGPPRPPRRPNGGPDDHPRGDSPFANGPQENDFRQNGNRGPGFGQPSSSPNDDPSEDPRGHGGPQHPENNHDRMNPHSPGDEGLGGRGLDGRYRMGENRNGSEVPGSPGRQFGQWPDVTTSGSQSGASSDIHSPQLPRFFNASGEGLDPWSQRLGPWDRATILSKAASPDAFSNVIVDSEPYRVLTHRLDRPGPPQFIQLGYPLAEVRRALAGLDGGLLALIPIGIIGAWLGAAFLTNRVLVRVKQFAQTAERMGATDLTERLAIEGEDEFADLGQTFNRLFDRLETAFKKQSQALEQQRRFTADASHELKTPLTVIKGTTSMALQADLSKSSSREAIEEIDRAASSMSVLVQDLLYLARADAGSLGSDRQEVLVIELLQRAAAPFNSMPGAPISLDIAEADSTVIVNEAEFVRLLTNLVSNARRYTPETGSVILGSDEHGRRIWVRDTGFGIAPEHLARLGERFYRADSARARDDGGTGLGLAIAKGIAEAHNATLTFSSVVGEGTTVCVNFNV